MLDISKVSSLLQSLGVASTAAAKAAERAASSSSSSDPVGFLKQLQASLEHLKEAKPDTQPADAAAGSQPAAASSTYTSTQQTFGSTQSAPAAKAPFESFEEFRTWERGLGNTFAADYQPPDYIRVMGLSLMDGDSGAFGRYVFFKNNPECAVDYEAIRSGALSKLPTDGSTLVKSDLSAMPEETASYYRKNPAALRMAEGFSMDPTLYKQRIDGKLDIPANTNATEWLTQNRWTANGVVANDNRLTLAQADYRGLDGNGAGTYRLAKTDPATGFLVDLDGRRYDPSSGTLMA